MTVYYVDQQDAALTTDVETPNIFGRNLLRRLGLAQGSEADATGTSSNNNITLIMHSLHLYDCISLKCICVIYDVCIIFTVSNTFQPH